MASTVSNGDHCLRKGKLRYKMLVNIKENIDIYFVRFNCSVKRANHSLYKMFGRIEFLLSFMMTVQAVEFKTAEIQTSDKLCSCTYTDSFRNVNK